MATFDITIRSARSPDDAPAIEQLSRILGYDATAEATAERLAAVLARDDHEVLVAVALDGRVVGWIHVFAAPRVESGGFAEIGGLVVDPSCRRRGVASRLVTAAEESAARFGFSTLRVRSHIDRRGAHCFFEDRDFHLAKTQRVYEKLVRATPRDRRSNG